MNIAHRNTSLSHFTLCSIRFVLTGHNYKQSSLPQHICTEMPHRHSLLLAANLLPCVAAAIVCITLAVPGIKVIWNFICEGSSDVPGKGAILCVSSYYTLAQGQTALCEGKRYSVPEQSGSKKVAVAAG